LSDIAKGILAGGWSLIAGWILPAAINLLLLYALVLPSMHGTKIIDSVLNESIAQRSLILFVASVVIGLMLNALQTPLYRFLEGYLLWPPGLVKVRRNYHLDKKSKLADQIDALSHPGTDEEINPAPSESLFPLKVGSKLAAFFRQGDRDRTAVQRAPLRERLHRYPVDNAQVAPTRLGNAIRRLEEYGFQRYKLDSQTLRYQLAGAAPRQMRDQVDTARTGVDFFVCLLYGNILVAFIALCTTVAPRANNVVLLISASALIFASLLWYRLAVVTTDDWAAAIRAMVDIGRKTLADAVGLAIPQELELERKMWQAYSRFVRRPFQEGKSVSLDQFRVSVLNDENKDSE
jgi:hypothetical protein